MSVLLLFPNQLFEVHLLPDKKHTVYLLEELLFFTQYKFHKQKLVFHRASMKSYEIYLKSKGFIVNYIEATESRNDVRLLMEELAAEGQKLIHYFDTTDNWLEQRINGSCTSYHIKTIKHVTPLFLNTIDETKDWFNEQKGYSQTAFYIEQRKLRNILMNEDGKPSGGKWTFDTENRLRYPKNKIPPAILFPETDSLYEESVTYVKNFFPANYGEINTGFVYPYTHQSALLWLNHFLEYRFAEFGIYEDAIVATNSVLHHSVLSPLINSGLLLPQQVLDIVLKFALENDIPFNTAEGFIRQLIGWREFIRVIYEREGTHQRNNNFWNFKRKLPQSFYSGTTGILPFDKTIRKLQSTGYVNHIERLMILGNVMLLCEIDPDEVYKWFMELFIDSYDWVMVPNVYGMSQFADGGLMSTKPYISGSNYILKMSDYPQGEWCEIWDALFWRFMHVHRNVFLKNPRLSMLVKTYDKMPEEKRIAYLKKAEKFILTLQ